ncbi:CU044_5270 family protein [Nonomuraea ferruginea]|uniref:CU044_5270 family protein n=1 Tax=Nonomuraea ferruginea TaxID=46174 RepID=A0ABT4SQP6_9ACTN|nr:CU044_5270 family protein [Nonomuraea ferruginea]MDA0639582.1 CU044_5270 family protein [Nonomuraea ferruginea]
MDELSLLARALPDAPPPSAEVVEKARARLAAAQHKPVRSGRADRRGLAWGWALGAATATVAVVMAVVTLASNGTAVPPPVLVPAGANDALLRLADQVAKLPDEDGDYWRRPLLNNGLMRVRAGGETFNVLSSSRIDLWQPRDPGDPVQVEQRQQFVRPATEADERAWQAAGSPRTVQRVCAPGTRAGDCAKVRLRAKPSQCMYTRAAEPGGVLGDSRLAELTLADLAALPGDAEQLREKLRTYWKARQDGPSKDSFEEFLSTSSALLELPVQPSVRAAALRLLAGLPTTKVLGSITDPLGRPGIEVTFMKSEGFVRQFGTGDEVAERYSTILDPRTGTVLTANAAIAVESSAGLAKGTFINYQAWAPESGWTGERPERPHGCRPSDRPLP